MHYPSGKNLANSTGRAAIDLPIIHWYLWYVATKERHE